MRELMDERTETLLLQAWPTQFIGTGIISKNYLVVEPAAIIAFLWPDHVIGGSDVVLTDSCIHHKYGAIICAGTASYYL
jgi:hypothetical protein